MVVGPNKNGKTLSPPGRSTSNNGLLSKPSSNGIRIQAQRKFAQGQSFYSPSTTPLKDNGDTKGHKRGRSPSPLPSLPLSNNAKRVKTEDFLHFLVLRGSGAIKPEQDFSEYKAEEANRPNDIVRSTEEIAKLIIFKELNTAKLSQDLSRKQAETTPIKRTGRQDSSTTIEDNGSLKSFSSRTSSFSNSSKTESKSSKGDGKRDSKSKLPKAGKSSSSKGKGDIDNDSKESLSKSNKTTANVKAEGKKSSITNKTDKPLKKTTDSKKNADNNCKASDKKFKSHHLNEKDARFAITALKVKDKEQKKGKDSPAVLKSVGNKADKKSTTLKSASATATPKRKTQEKEKPKEPIKKIPRSAPSPDIIDCVKARKSTPAVKKPKSESSDNSSSSESSEESEKLETPPKSLRSGKNVVSAPKTKSKPFKSIVAKKKSILTAAIRCIRTRATRRTKSSPLRELPMYAIKSKVKKRAIQKTKKPSAKKSEKGKSSSKRESTDDEDDKKSSTEVRSRLRQKKSKSPKKDGCRSRPSRKTKETAAIYLDLLNKEFSSDAEDSGRERKQRSHSSDSSTSTDSSEAYFKKGYEAEKKKKEQQQQANKSKPQTTKKVVRATRSNRNLNSAKAKKKSSIGSPLLNIKAEGAARKSAAINPNYRDHTSSSSEDEENSSKSDSSHSSESSKKSRVKTTPARSVGKKEKTPVVKSSTSSSSEDESKPASPMEVNEEQVVISSSSTSSSDSEDEVIKVDCSIQCDMDADSEAEDLKPELSKEQPTASPDILSSKCKDKEEASTSKTEPTPPPSMPNISNVNVPPHIPTYHSTVPGFPPAFSTNSFNRPPNHSEFYTPLNFNTPAAAPPGAASAYLNSIHVVNGTTTTQQFSMINQPHQPMAFALPTHQARMPATNIFPVNPTPGAMWEQQQTPTFGSTLSTLSTTFETHHIRTNIHQSSLISSLTRPAQPFVHPPSVVGGFLQPPRRPLVWNPIEESSNLSAFRPATMGGEKPKVSSHMLPLSIIQPHVSNGLPMSQHIRAPYSTLDFRTGNNSTSEAASSSSFVSIVPKKEEKIVIPGSSKVKDEKKVYSNIPGVRDVTDLVAKKSGEPTVPKKKGRKRKNEIPKPMSPLTVRKDSITPVTYSSTKKKEMEESNSSKSKSDGDPFIKLLQMKKASSSEEDTKKVGESSEDDEVPCSSKKIPKIEPERKQIFEVPAFYPTEKEFEDPLKYFEKIRSEAEGFGMAKIVPPKSFRPECNVSDDMRFTAYNHHVHKLWKRWGPNVHETCAIQEHLRKLEVDFSSPPMISGVEINLSTLYSVIQSFGGGNEVLGKQLWTKVADALHVPKSAHEREAKLDAIYVKYILPFEILSKDERKKLMTQVEEMWTQRQDKKLEESSDADESSDEDDIFEEVDACVVKGKSTPLNAYYRIARNTAAAVFKNKEVTPTEAEDEYWKIVRDRTKNLCVYSGSIDCTDVGWGFPQPKNSQTKHPWNLKVLANNSASVLKSMGPVMGASVPTLNVGMVFTSYCWYKDPHNLAWIEYLHSGAEKIWYTVTEKHEDLFRKVLTEMMPLQCKSKEKIWLPSDSVMVPIDELVKQGVEISRTVQKPGEFLLVFPKTFTSAICTGYLISESVSFATKSWLKSCIQTFRDMKDSKEPPVFPLEKLLFSILDDPKVSRGILKHALVCTEEIIKTEIKLRKVLVGNLGLSKKKGKLVDDTKKTSAKSSKSKEQEETIQCDLCNYILTLSAVMVKMKRIERTLCLEDAVKYFAKHKTHLKSSHLLFHYSEEELNSKLKSGKKKLEKSSV